MKKHLLTFSFLIFSTFSFSQTFIKIGDKLTTETKFLLDLEVLKKENLKKHIAVQVFEQVTNNDSIIKNTTIGIYKDETKATKLYYNLLNKPFPNFKFQGLNNNWYSKSRFIGKPTIICFIDQKFKPTNKEIKQLNALNKNNNYHVVAFLADKTVNKSSFKKIEFPILKDCSNWLLLNFFNHSFPQYMLMDKSGNLTYFFPEYPTKNSQFKPINKETSQIFNLLLYNSIK